jgi:hypothetical protein
MGPDGAVVIGLGLKRASEVATVRMPQPVNDSGLRSIRATRWARSGLAMPENRHCTLL